MVLFVCLFVCLFVLPCFTLVDVPQYPCAGEPGVVLTEIFQELEVVVDEGI